MVQVPPPREPSPPEAAREALLEWYRPRREAYPWRRVATDSYRILVTEVMAQQTQAPRVASVFTPFVERFPSIEALAAASRADVLRAWSGLGYNGRAVALHEAAREIVREHAGTVPRDIGALLALPGVGPYTAAAVASIAYGEPVAAIDTNVRRVIARAARGAEPDELTPAELAADADAWLDRRDPGTWNQAVMDVGRALCRPVAPRCDQCPLARWCSFAASGRVGRRSAKRQPRFEGSPRQVRGAVVRALRDLPEASRSEIASATGFHRDRIGTAIGSLLRDGLVERAGRDRVRLHRGAG
ncbi:MAG: A/G-specific adenine glycosylase [Actinomycetota bacterium]|nr:A/G-specific adenine glycosylase [Actinomycetota bacterium]